MRLAKTLRPGPRHDRTKVRAVSNLPRPWELAGADGAPVVNEGRDFQGWDVEAPHKRGDGNEPPPDLA